MNQSIPTFLASGSPRRKDLLEKEGIPFEVMVSGVEEVPWPEEQPASFALRMAFEKAGEVAGRVRDTCREQRFLVIAADTIVVKDGVIYGKPADEADAARMLQSLSGGWHQVITGLCVMDCSGDTQTMHGDAVMTGVLFKPLAEETIHAYVATGEPMDKAGAYAIQGGAAPMILEADGSWTNVVGLPMEALRVILDRIQAG